MNNNEVNTPGQRLQVSRELKGITQDKMATYLGISTRQYQNLEYGTRDLIIKHCLKIKEVLGISIDYLLTGSVCNEKDFMSFFMVQEPEKQFNTFLRLQAYLFKCNNKRYIKLMEKLSEDIEEN